MFRYKVKETKFKRLLLGKEKGPTFVDCFKESMTFCVRKESNDRGEKSVHLQSNLKENYRFGNIIHCRGQHKKKIPAFEV